MKFFPVPMDNFRVAYNTYLYTCLFLMGATAAQIMPLWLSIPVAAIPATWLNIWASRRVAEIDARYNR